MLIEHAAQKYASPVRGDMFIDHATPKTVEPRRGGMIDRISRHGDRATTIGVKTEFHAAPYGAEKGMLISLIRDPFIPKGCQHVAGGCAKHHPRFPSDDDPIPEGSQNEQA